MDGGDVPREQEHGGVRRERAGRRAATAAGSKVTARAGGCLTLEWRVTDGGVVPVHS